MDGLLRRVGLPENDGSHCSLAQRRCDKRQSAARRYIRTVKALLKRVVAKLSEDWKVSPIELTSHQLTRKYNTNMAKQQQRTLPVISQCDMALTQTGFFGTALLLQSQRGLRCIDRKWRNIFTCGN